MTLLGETDTNGVTDKIEVWERRCRRAVAGGKQREIYGPFFPTVSLVATLWVLSVRPHSVRNVQWEILPVSRLKRPCAFSSSLMLRPSIQQTESGIKSHFLFCLTVAQLNFHCVTAMVTKDNVWAANSCKSLLLNSREGAVRISITSYHGALKA